MSNMRFKFRFAAVKSNLLREQKIAEMKLLECNDQMKRSLENLDRHYREQLTAVDQWQQSVSSEPAIAMQSIAGFTLLGNQEHEIRNRIADCNEACLIAEQQLAEVRKRLRSIEKLEEDDRDEFNAKIKRHETMIFQDEVLARWNRTC